MRLMTITIMCIKLQKKKSFNYIVMIAVEFIDLGRQKKVLHKKEWTVLGKREYSMII